jgi:hypothetical protein
VKLNKKEKSMNKIFKTTLISAIVMGLALSIATLFSAPISSTTSTQNWGGFTLEKTISASAADSLYIDSSTGYVYLLKDFTPSGGRQYFIARDTASSYGTVGSRDSCILMLRLDAKSGKGGVVVGTMNIDTIGKNQGKTTDNYYVPFGDGLIGSVYDLTMRASTAKDSLILNHCYLFSRANLAVGTGLFGR